MHELEAIPGLQAALLESVQRSPSYYSVWMLNRFLNSEQSSAERASFLEALRWVRENSVEFRDQAQEYLEHLTGLES